MRCDSYITVVKVGTNVITNDEGLLDHDAISQIVEQVCMLKKQDRMIILVSSGAMAAGRERLKGHDKAQTVLERQMLAAVGQAALIDAYSQAFAKHNFLCAQVLTTKEDFRSRDHYLNMQRCFLGLLQDGVVPIVNENDVTSVEELMFTDNDELAGLIATMTDAANLVVLTSVDGVLGKDGRPVESFAADDNSWEELIESGTSKLGRGGMRTKCAMAQKLAKTGITTYITNGKERNVILNAVDERHIGTCFKAAEKQSPVKRWLAQSEGSEKGRVVINSCAVDLLVGDKVVSLLPVGVVKIAADFEKGDVIQICNEKGKKIALGKAQYSSAEAEPLCLKKDQKPLVHYDYLYVL